MGEKTKNLAIGIFVLFAIFLVVYIIMFLKPSVGDMKQTLYVRFSNINKINVGTRVMFAGKAVGEVVAIREIYNAREQPTDSLNRVYFYELVLKIDSGINRLLPIKRTSSLNNSRKGSTNLNFISLGKPPTL